MLSYHADPMIKARYLARVEGHAADDEIVKGQYWQAGKGCAVGCTVHGASHAHFESELGIPQMLAWLEDVIFEGLPNRAAKTWPVRFLSAIEPGTDLSRVGWQFLYWLLTGNRPDQHDHPAIDEAVSQCAALILPLAEGRPVDAPAARVAAASAWAAAHAAEAAAGASTQVQWIAESAAHAAESAALSETCRGSSAEHAMQAVTAAVARSADYVKLGDKLIELLTTA